MTSNIIGDDDVGDSCLDIILEGRCHSVVDVDVLLSLLKVNNPVRKDERMTAGDGCNTSDGIAM